VTDAPLHHVETHPVDRNGAPMPVPTDGPSMHDLVAADLAGRKAFGLARYGSLLQAHNGRRALQDAYEEILDLAVYLKQHLVELEHGEQALVRKERERAARERTLAGYRTTSDEADLDRLYGRLAEHLNLEHGASLDDMVASPRTELVQRHLNAHRFGRGVVHEYQPWGDPL
jgi:hypothetical protein